VVLSWQYKELKGSNNY